MGRKKKRLRRLRLQKKNTIVAAPVTPSVPKATTPAPAPKKVVEVSREVPPKPQKVPKVTNWRSVIASGKTKKPTSN